MWIEFEQFINLPNFLRYFSIYIYITQKLVTCDLVNLLSILRGQQYATY